MRWLLLLALAAVVVLVAWPAPPRPPIPPPVRPTLEEIDEAFAAAEPPAVPATTATTAVITGRVLAADSGAPIEGAILDYDGRKPFAKSGADGSFRLEGVPPGEWSIAAWPPEHAMASRDVVVAAGESKSLDLFVRPGAAVEGKVLVDGAPAAGATVRCAEGSKSVVTGKDGTFVLRGFLPEDEWFEVEVPDFLPQSFNVEIPPGVARVPCTFEVRRAWKASGTVLLEGKPVAGARVSTTWREIAGPKFNGAVTSADGTFVLESIDDPHHDSLWAWSESAGLGCSAEFDPVGGTKEPVLIVLEPKGAAVVIVEDEAGKPVPGASIAAHRRSEPSRELDVEGDERSGRPPSTMAVTDAKGEAEMSLQPGNWEFRVRAEGFFGVDAVGDAGMGIGTPRIPVVLRRGGDLEGRVVDDAGKPVAGATVRTNRFRDVDRPPVVTGADGTFRFRTVQDEEYIVYASKDGWSGGPSTAVRAGKPIEIVLRPASTVRGRVLLADGKTPARAFTLRLWFEATEDGKPWKDQGWPFKTEELTDADGRFAIPDVEPGTIGVEAECGDLLAPRVSVVTKPGTDPADLSLVLRPAASIAVRVLDSGGGPLPQATVTLSTPWGGAPQAEQEDEEWAVVRQATAGPDGKFEFRALQAGRYRLESESVSLISAEVRLKVSSGEAAAINLVLWRGGRVRVEATGSDGERLEEGCLAFFEEDPAQEPGKEREPPKEREVGFAREGVVVMGTNSWFTFDSLEDDSLMPGSYRARVQAEGHEDAEVRFTVKEGQTTTVKAVLRKSP